MAELSPDIVAEVFQRCQAGAEEAGAAFGRAFDVEVQLSVGQPGTIDIEALPDGLASPGLAIVLTVGGVGALILVPEGPGLLPSWVADADPSGESRLATLAQELGAVLLPDEFNPEGVQAARVESLAEVLDRGGVSGGAAMVPLEFHTGDGEKVVAGLIWPAADPAAVFGTPAAEPAAQPEPNRGPSDKALPEAGRATQPEPLETPNQAPGRRAATVDDLPPYSRSLLRIKVPVVVTLAEKRQSLGLIMELGPGSLIQFDKSCEEMLDLDVGGRPMAKGEAVKVGDKFGLRVHSIILPEERFLPVKRGR